MPLTFLWIVPKSPVPPIDGARLASHNLVQGILREGAQVHLVVLPPAHEARLVDPAAFTRELPVSRISVQPRPEPALRVLRWVSATLAWARNCRFPLTVAPFAAPAVARAVSDMLRDFSGDLVVYDGLHCAAHLYDRRERIRAARPYLLRAHNREAELWRRKASLSSNAVERRFLSANARAMARFETAVVRHARAVATVSDLDRSIFLEASPDLPAGRIATVPIGYEFGPPPAFPETGPRRLLFVGRLDWPPNREGLSWFLDEVWPAAIAEAPRWSLTIAGSGDGRWLQRYRQLARLEILGFVDDLAGLYQSSSLVIVPVFFGGGTRVKVIEAGRFGRPCLSTSVGVEGLGLSKGVDYCGAETAEEWVGCLKRVTSAELGVMGRNAWQRLRPTYDLQSAARAFLALAARACGDA